jgi:hypothetical protein
MDHQAELRAQRDTLEAELLVLEQDMQGQRPEGATVPIELLERVDALLRRLKQINQALCTAPDAPPA